MKAKTQSLTEARRIKCYSLLVETKPPTPIEAYYAGVAMGLIEAEGLNMERAEAAFRGYLIMAFPSQIKAQ